MAKKEKKKVVEVSIAKKVNIVRDVIADGVDKHMVQLKVLPRRDKEGIIIDDLKGGFTFDIYPEAFGEILAERLMDRDDMGNMVDMGRPIDVIKGTMTLELVVERAEIIER